MKYKNILLIMIVGILSLNLVFAANSYMSKTYRISGNLEINQKMIDHCANGSPYSSNGNYFEAYQDDGGEPNANFQNLNNLFIKLFFAAPVQYTQKTCRIEIYSPNNKITPKMVAYNLNANGLKQALEQGILIGPINADREVSLLEFKVKIMARTGSGIDNTLLETVVVVPNINAQLSIAAEKVTNPLFANNLSIVNNQEPSTKIDHLLALNSASGSFEWTKIKEKHIASKSIYERHLSNELAEIIDSKVSNLVVASTNSTQSYSGPIKYLKIPVEENGEIVTYVIPLLKLNSYTPILDGPSMISARVGSGDGVLLINFSDIKESSINVSAENNNNTLTNVSSTVITENGIKKLKINFTCNKASEASMLPKLKITAKDPDNNDVSPPKMIDVNCYYDDGSVFIQGVDNRFLNVGYPEDFKAVLGNVDLATVSWSLSYNEGSAHLEQPTPGLPGKATVVCTSPRAGINIQISAKQLKDNTIVTDNKFFSCKTPSSPCFKEGTKVYTSNGWKNIESIKAGEKVYSYSDDHKLVETEVKKLLIHEDNQIDNSVKLELSNGKVLFVTTNHAFYSPTEEIYKQLHTFNIGDSLLYYNTIENKFENVQIINITKVPSFTIFYNLSLDQPNNYLAEGIVVHNDKKDIDYPGGGGYSQGH